jgi:Ca2+-binding EF-hand superfamily protein
MNTKMGLALSLVTMLGGSAVAFADQNPNVASDPGCATKREGFKEKMLAKYDANKNGVLDADEKAKMRSDFQAKRTEKKAEILARFDTNKNGVLDPDEKAAMQDERATKLLAKLDTNGDGQLSVDEVKCGPLARRFEQIDTNKDGELSKAELVAAGPLFHHHHRA